MPLSTSWNLSDLDDTEESPWNSDWPNKILFEILETFDEPPTPKMSYREKKQFLQLHNAHRMYANPFEKLGSNQTNQQIIDMKPSAQIAKFSWENIISHPIYKEKIPKLTHEFVDSTKNRQGQYVVSCELKDPNLQIPGVQEKYVFVLKYGPRQTAVKYWCNWIAWYWARNWYKAKNLSPASATFTAGMSNKTNMLIWIPHLWGNNFRHKIDSTEPNDVNYLFDKFAKTSPRDNVQLMNFLSKNWTKHELTDVNKIIATNFFLFHMAYQLTTNTESQNTLTNLIKFFPVSKFDRQIFGGCAWRTKPDQFAQLPYPTSMKTWFVDLDTILAFDPNIFEEIIPKSDDCQSSYTKSVYDKHLQTISDSKLTISEVLTLTQNNFKDNYICFASYQIWPLPPSPQNKNYNLHLFYVFVWTKETIKLCKVAYVVLSSTVTMTTNLPQLQSDNVSIFKQLVCLKLSHDFSKLTTLSYDIKELQANLGFCFRQMSNVTDREKIIEAARFFATLINKTKKKVSLQFYLTEFVNKHLSSSHLHNQQNKKRCALFQANQLSSNLEIFDDTDKKKFLDVVAHICTNMWHDAPTTENEPVRNFVVLICGIQCQSKQAKERPYAMEPDYYWDQHVKKIVSTIPNTCVMFHTKDHFEFIIDFETKAQTGQSGQSILYRKQIHDF